MGGRGVKQMGDGDKTNSMFVFVCYLYAICMIFTCFSSVHHVKTRYAQTVGMHQCIQYQHYNILVVGTIYS